MEIKKLQEYAKLYEASISGVKKEAKDVRTKALSAFNISDRVEFSSNQSKAFFETYEKSRMDRVRLLKEKIETGSYSIDTSEIAKKMVEESW